MRYKNYSSMLLIRRFQASIILMSVLFVSACGSSGPDSSNTVDKRGKAISEYEPQGLTAQSQESAVILKWPIVTNAKAYHLYWSTNPEADKTTSQRLENVVSPYTHTNLSNNTAYYYHYTVEDDTGESSSSEVIQITPKISPASVPRRLKVFPADGQNVLHWLPPADLLEADSNNLMYKIYWSATGDFSDDNQSIEATQPPYIHRGLLNDTQYYYRVAAMYKNVEGELSTEATGAPRWPKLVPPRTFTVTIGNRQTTLQWDSVENASQYAIYWNNEGSVTNDDERIIVTDSPYIHQNLNNSVQHYYRIAALHSGGESILSKEVSISPFAPRPSTPKNISAVAGVKQATLDWQPPEEDAEAYNVYWQAENHTNVLGNVKPPVVISGLKAQIPISFAVTAVRDNRESLRSAEVSVTPLALPPDAPGDLIIIPGDEHVTIRWGVSDDAESYNIYWNNSGNVTDEDNRILGVTPPYTLDNLFNGTDYFFIVTAVNSDGVEGEYSAELVATPIKILPVPDQPKQLMAIAGDATATLSWETVANASGYNLYWSTNEIVTLHDAVIENVQPPYVHQSLFNNISLNNGTTYYYGITAINAARESKLSEVVSVTPVIPTSGNQAPQITSSAITGATQGSVYQYEVQAHDPDAGDTLTYSLTTAPSGMGINGSGVITWSPTNDDVVTSPHSVTVRVTDQQSAFDTQSFSVTVGNANDAPTDIQLSASTVSENATVNTVVGNLTVTDPDVGDSHTLALTAATSNRGFGLNGTQLIVNDPSKLDFETNPSPSITVRATDGGRLSVEKSFTLNVTDANDAPRLGNNTLTLNEGQTVTLTSTNLSATDADNDPLTYTVSNVVRGHFAHSSALGTPITRFTQTQLSAGQIRFVHDGSESAPGYHVAVSDSQSSTTPSTASIHFTNLNDAPQITSSAITGATQGSVYRYEVQAQDPDAGDTLTYSLTTAPSGMSINGSGVITWSPTNADVNNSPHSVTVRVSDRQSATDTQSFAITVSNANDAPTDIQLSANSVSEHAAANTVVGNLTATDPDVGNSHTFVVTSVTSDRGFGINGTQLTVNDPSKLDFETSPSPSVTVRATDGGGLSVEKSFTLNVTNANDAPQLGSNTLTLNEGQTVTLNSTNLSASDADLDPLTYTVRNVTRGYFARSSAPSTAITSFTQTQLSAGQIRFVHDGSESAPGYHVAVSDSQSSTTPSTASIHFTNLNDAPQITSSAITGATQGSVYRYEVQAQDPDAGDTLTYSLTTAPSGMSINGSGVITWSPTNADVNNSPHSVTVRVTDQQSAFDTQSFSVTVGNANDAPTDIQLSANAVSEHAAANTVVGNLTATDPDVGDSHTFALTSATSDRGFGINGTQLIVNDPSKLDHETSPSPSVTIRATDGGGLSVEKSFTLTVTDANDAPIITEGSTTIVTMDEDSSPIPFNLTLHASDADGDILNWSISSSPTNGIATANGTGNSKAILYTPDVNFSGTDTFVVRVSDGRTGIDTIIVSVTISAQNDLPLVQAQLPDQTATQDVAFNFQFAANSFSDPDDDTLSYTALLEGGGSLPGWLTFTGATRTFQGTPGIDDADVMLSVAVTADDGKGGSVEDVFQITVESVNIPPEGIIESPSQQTIAVEVGSSLYFKGSGVDEGGNLPLTYLWDFGTSGIPQDTASTPATKVFSSVGIYTVSLTVTNSLDISDPTPETRTINVSNRPTASIVSPSSTQYITPGESVTFVAAVSDVEDDSDAMTYMWEFWKDGEIWLEVASLNTGPIMFNDPGLYQLNFRVTDSAGLSAYAYQTTTVSSPVLDASFGSEENGRASFDHEEDMEVGRSIAVNSANRIIVAGDNANYSVETGYVSDILLWRYNSTGVPDTSFAGNGFIRHDLGTNSYDIVTSMVIDHAGRIVVTGRTGDDQSIINMYIARFDANGNLDGNFGNGGYVIDSGRDGIGNAVTIDSAGRILIAGQSPATYNGGSQDMVMWRFNESGQPDTSFGNNGFVTYDYTAIAHAKEAAYSVTIDSLNRIVVAGSLTSASAVDDDMAVWRYDQSGNIDTSFGNNGVVFYQNRPAGFGVLDDFAYSVKVDSSNRIVVAGTTTNVHTISSGDKDVTLLRYNQDGSLDASFGTNGMVIIDSAAGSNNAPDVAHDLMLDSLGNMYVVGYTYYWQGQRPIIWKFNASGQADTSFGFSGSGSYRVSGLLADNVKFNAHMYSLAYDNNGNIVVVGMSENNKAASGLHKDMLIWRFRF